MAVVAVVHSLSEKDNGSGSGSNIEDYGDCNNENAIQATLHVERISLKRPDWRSYNIDCIAIMDVMMNKPVSSYKS
ncbi:hypothetical protein NTE_00214 [Candidatus Nitrososphaera evergladensis SR1]|uniref:Uncharacterized protein n=1 Tax=Candidatus Nitrososphaera evergladensis SR1 TaxID=1459636 RepID=A0A075MLG8_9ARCH|nr:hypothetical protein NTE_00214 [Candidatus Nitrososphaera evergladensis SR1]